MRTKHGLGPQGYGNAAGASEEAEPKERSTSSLVVVAFLGSLDDLTLFVPMLVGQALTWIELSAPEQQPPPPSNPPMHIRTRTHTYHFLPTLCLVN